VDGTVGPRVLINVATLVHSTEHVQGQLQNNVVENVLIILEKHKTVIAMLVVMVVLQLTGIVLVGLDLVEHVVKMVRCPWTKQNNIVISGLLAN